MTASDSNIRYHRPIKSHVESYDVIFFEIVYLNFSIPFIFQFIFNSIVYFSVEYERFQV